MMLAAAFLSWVSSSGSCITSSRKAITFVFSSLLLSKSWRATDSTQAGGLKTKRLIITFNHWPYSKLVYQRFIKSWYFWCYFEMFSILGNALDYSLQQAFFPIYSVTYSADTYMSVSIIQHFMVQQLFLAKGRHHGSGWWKASFLPSKK